MLYQFIVKKVQIVLLSFILLLPGCSDEYVCPVPNVPLFSFDVLVRTSEPLTAKTVSGYGYKLHGIIVYHHYDNEVFAFDATCPDSEECISSGVVAFDGDARVTGTCKRCHSQYNLMDGHHASKEIMLRPYNVQRIANTAEQYRVSNN